MSNVKPGLPTEHKHNTCCLIRTALPEQPCKPDPTHQSSVLLLAVKKETPISELMPESF